VAGVRQVVVGVSGSPGSIRALRIAADHASRDDVLLVAVHAWQPPGGDYADRRSPSPCLRAIWKRAAAERLREAIDSAWGGPPAGVSFDCVVARGPAGPVLLQIADSAADLLVVGAGQRGLPGRVWRGRVTRYCQGRAECPVLAVPPPAVASKPWSRASRWSLRYRELTADQVLREMQGLGQGDR
jgi:nucleotide-binding universal stress UspA family protein